MQHYTLSILLLGAATFTASADFALTEPENSALAEGHWVKIRVAGNGVYGFSHDRLRELGFDNPEAVHVFGYDPTLLLCHNFESAPSDMNLIASINENEQLAFYAVGNVDYRAEMWPLSGNPNLNNRKVHAYSTGATYFLSDINVDSSDILTQILPPAEGWDDNMTIYSTHDALVYHEEDSYSPGAGSIWLCGPAMKKSDSQTHQITIGKAVGPGRLTYMGLMSPSASGSNYFITEFSNNIKTSSFLPNVGINAGALLNYQLFRHCIKSQTLEFPEESSQAEFSFNLTFTPNPAGKSFVRDAGIDYFGIVYERRNDLADERQMLMYFNNTDTVTGFALSGVEDSDTWHVWNVTSFANIAEYTFGECNQELKGILPIAGKDCPNTIIAFRSNVPQPEPEILGIIDNQNLHAISVPDLLIITTKSMMPAGEIAADFHRKWQNYDVLVVDQQQIFNEYGSGNVSPEAVRRFIAHLYQKDSEKLKSVLLVGAGTYMNAQRIKDDEPYVVTAQQELYTKANVETANPTTDAFFTSFTHRIPTKDDDKWQNGYSQLLAAGMTLPIGRLPFSQVSDVESYYKKAEQYMGNKHSSPEIGNLLLASDYATRVEDNHMANGEALYAAIPEEEKSLLTCTRAASNLFSANDNNITRKVLLSALQRGVGFYAFFGHGTSAQIGGSNKTTDYLTHVNTALSQNHPGKYPVIFMGSCLTGDFDKTLGNLSAFMLKNEFGGGIALISASRVVFQARNEELGKQVIKQFYSLKPGQLLGDVWKASVNKFVSSTTNYDLIVNTSAYNFLGDPALPAHVRSHSIEFDEFEQIVAGGNNTLKGYIKDGEAVDENFNGNVLISVYDSPQTLKNVAPNVDSPAPSTITSCEIDQELIGEYYATVENGRFEISFRGPRSGRPSNHRIQAYAYADNNESLALGVLPAVPMVEDENPSESPIYDLPEIRSFVAGDGNVDSYIDGAALELTADIYVPAGIADANALLNPVRLTIDGVTITNLRNQLSVVDENTFALSYRVTGLSGGRHEASLRVLDADGNYASSAVEFTLDNAPKATLSVAVGDDGANFELAFDNSATINNTYLIIENLAGEPIKYITLENKTTSCNVNDLKSGAYRAYMQLDGDKVATATPKIEVIIN